jgi:hypothetical protein
LNPNQQSKDRTFAYDGEAMKQQGYTTFAQTKIIQPETDEGNHLLG